MPGKAGDRGATAQDKCLFVGQGTDIVKWRRAERRGILFIDIVAVNWAAEGNLPRLPVPSRCHFSFKDFCKKPWPRVGFPSAPRHADRLLKSRRNSTLYPNDTFFTRRGKRAHEPPMSLLASPARWNALRAQQNRRCCHRRRESSRGFSIKGILVLDG